MLEGINPEKANEITIDKTVELCRSNTSSDLVKSVLESTKFDTPREVIAKLTIQQSKIKTESVAYNIRHFNRTNQVHCKKNYRPFNKTNFNRPQRFHNNYPRSFNQNNQNRNFHNNNNQKRNFHRQSNFRNNHRSVRHFESGNGPPPQEISLGEENQKQD